MPSPLAPRANRVSTDGGGGSWRHKCLSRGDSTVLRGVTRVITRCVAQTELADACVALALARRTGGARRVGGGGDADGLSDTDGRSDVGGHVERGADADAARVAAAADGGARLGGGGGATSGAAPTAVLATSALRRHSNAMVAASGAASMNSR